MLKDLCANSWWLRRILRVSRHDKILNKTIRNAETRRGFREHCPKEMIKIDVVFVDKDKSANQVLIGIREWKRRREDHRRIGRMPLETT